ncbi:MAG: YdeI/OmpD-associated family protein [Chloroflexia bacterium]|nr:YdeI/OmpD-associated family protein [Chloroflexia bacterium]
MERNDLVFFETQGNWRQWLTDHHATTRELWVGFYKKGSGIPSITWPESVDEALCFGWIDGVRKRIDETRYRIRFTPRKPGSTWSSVNVKRVGELTEAGLMCPAGVTAFAARDLAKSGTYAYENAPAALNDEFERRFRANESAWRFFQAQAPSYQRTCIWWVMSAKQEKTRQTRLSTLIDDSEHGRMSGTSWQSRRT